MAVSDCIFCRIINKELPSQVVFENELALVIKDIKPEAPIHLLAIPKMHVNNICDPRLLEPGILNALYSGIQEVARILNIKEDGFRVVSNIGHFAGETIPHFHIHILAGRQLKADMG
jgi:histidine triad (HIT) family protein